jgi:hypothetical protein
MPLYQGYTADKLQHCSCKVQGDFDLYLKGTPKISHLKNGDRLLILESCTHHVSCDDIGRVKIPRWISNFTGKQLEFDIVGGLGGTAPSNNMTMHWWFSAGVA